MVEQAIENLKIEVPKLDFIGVGVGPGSLTV
jgi:tRNA A37 threonylcarbamoyladenosine modification protein TsaB